MHEDLSIRVTRYDAISVPGIVVVGFIVAHVPSGREMYKETSVPSSETDGKTETEVAEIAWNGCRSDVCRWSERCDAPIETSQIVGAEFVPPPPPPPEPPAPEEEEPQPDPVPQEEAPPAPVEEQPQPDPVPEEEAPPAPVEEQPQPDPVPQEEAPPVEEPVV